MINKKPAFENALRYFIKMHPDIKQYQSGDDIKYRDPLYFYYMQTHTIPEDVTWSEISNVSHLSESFIRDFADKLNWKSLCKWNTFSESFI